jgi:hypothetical protein
MFILNILENGVEGIKLEYPKNVSNNIKKIFFLNNIVAEKSTKRNERLSYLKKLNCSGLTFYIVNEKDVQNITKNQWDELSRHLDSKNKKILMKILNFSQNNKYTRSRNNRFNKSNNFYNNKTKKYKHR